MENDGNNSDTDQVKSAKDLKDRIKQLYGASMISMISHCSI
jgi:hypothetical protein